MNVEMMSDRFGYVDYELFVQREKGSGGLRFYVKPLHTYLVLISRSCSRPASVHMGCMTRTRVIANPCPSA